MTSRKYQANTASGKIKRARMIASEASSNAEDALALAEQANTALGLPAIARTV